MKNNLANQLANTSLFVCNLFAKIGILCCITAFVSWFFWPNVFSLITQISIKILLAQIIAAIAYIVGVETQF